MVSFWVQHIYSNLGKIWRTTCSVIGRSGTFFCSYIYLCVPGSLKQLWAIMSRNSSQMFIAEIANRKFLQTVEELITSSGTSPVVRERLLDVVGAVAYNSK